jgi:hypothetical protein
MIRRLPSGWRMTSRSWRPLQPPGKCGWSSSTRSGSCSCRPSAVPTPLRGRTPIQRAGEPHGLISGIGAIAVSPLLSDVRLRYTLLADQANFRGPSVVPFLRELRSDLGGPMTVIWDPIPVHECSAVIGFLAGHPDVVVEPVPPYAPELNPADGIWQFIKCGRLPNYAPYQLDELRGKTTDELDRLKDSPELLKSVIRFTKLPLEL